MLRRWRRVVLSGAALNKFEQGKEDRARIAMAEQRRREANEGPVVQCDLRCEGALLGFVTVALLLCLAGGASVRHD